MSVGMERPAGISDEQLSIAEDIAASTALGHADECQVWSEDGDDCTCGLRYAIAAGLKHARIVAVEQEMGWDPKTRRGDRVVRVEVNPMPTEATDAD